jgi:hypothetical protein
MADRRALLLAKMDPPGEHEQEWNDWYSHQHCAARIKSPGFLSGRRFSKIEGIPSATSIPGDAKYMALYDLANLEVLNGQPYQELRNRELAKAADSFDVQIFKLPKFARAAYIQIYPEKGDYGVPSSPLVFMVGHDIPAGKEAEFNAWYNTEHIPALMQVPGFLTVRRFILDERIVPPAVDRGGILSKYLTIYDIENEKAFETGAFQKASMTPWTVWVRSWYTRKVCMLYRRIYP